MNRIKPVVLSLSLLASQLSLAQSIIPAQSQIKFTIKEMGVPVEGEFKSWASDFTFDPKHPETSRFEFTIFAGSASIGSPEMDAEIRKPEWLNVARFPNATFASTAIRAVGGGRFELTGQFTAKGITKSIVVPLAVSQSGSVTTATGAFTIRRSDYKVGTGEWADTSQVADEVQVKVRLKLTGVAPL